MSPETVLVTGATGLFGGNLARALNRAGSAGFACSCVGRAGPWPSKGFATRWQPATSADRAAVAEALRGCRQA